MSPYPTPPSQKSGEDTYTKWHSGMMQLPVVLEKFIQFGIKY